MKHLASVALLLLAADALAQGPLPSLELGAGVGVISLPDYRGSSSSSTHVLPLPYIKYRGDRVRVDNGVRAFFFESEDLLLTLSANLAMAGDDNTSERKGMDNLNPLFEIGPALNYRLHKLQYGSLWFDLLLRYAYTLDSDFDHVGEVFEPRLAWRKPANRLGEWKLRYSISPLFASKDYHEYFYSVASDEATSSRPAYDADGGYSGLRSEFTVSKRIGKFWLGGFIRYDNLRNSVIDDSPLVTEPESWLGGIALSWVFYEK
jgi:outer membrane scaffolding protein for murein synthesis (MipA/OmpV family)